MGQLTLNEFYENIETKRSDSNDEKLSEIRLRRMIRDEIEDRVLDFGKEKIDPYFIHLLNHPSDFFDDPELLDYVNEFVYKNLGVSLEALKCIAITHKNNHTMVNAFRYAV